VRVATLISWVLTAGIGAYMLRSLIGHGGLRRKLASRDRLPPVLLSGHFGLALTGLAVWVSYVGTGWAWLAWAAVGLLMPAIGLGISTVTLWTPYPGPAGAPVGGPLAEPGDARPGEHTLVSELPDEELSAALTDEVVTARLIDDMVRHLLDDPPGGARKAWQPNALVPAGHGIAATTTFLLAVLTAAGMR
jgi:hypothetical protein